MERIRGRIRKCTVKYDQRGIEESFYCQLFWGSERRKLIKRWQGNGHSSFSDSSYYQAQLQSRNTMRKHKGLWGTHSSPQWMMKDMLALQSELWSGVETASQYYFTWFVVFFCCSDKVGLRLVSLQQAHALRMTLPERGRGEGVEETFRQLHQRQQVEMDSNSLGPNQMYGGGCKWIMNLGGFGANCADRKGIFMNNSLCRGPNHPPPTSITLFLQNPSSLYYPLTLIISYNLSPVMPIRPFVLECTLFVYV